MAANLSTVSPSFIFFSFHFIANKNKKKKSIIPNKKLNFIFRQASNEKLLKCDEMKRLKKRMCDMLQEVGKLVMKFQTKKKLEKYFRAFKAIKFKKLNINVGKI